MKFTKYRILCSALIFIVFGCGPVQENDDVAKLCAASSALPNADSVIYDENTLEAPFVDNSRAIKDLGTTFVVEKFFQTPTTLYNFMNVVYSGIDASLTQYRNEHKLTDRAAYLLFKGGNVLRMVANGYFDILPAAYRDDLMQKYAQYFKRSDADFSVYVDKNLISDYDQAFGEITLLNYQELNKIRDIFIADPAKYFDFAGFEPNKAQQTLEPFFGQLQALDITRDPANTDWSGAEFLGAQLPQATVPKDGFCAYDGEYDYQFMRQSDAGSIKVKRLNEQPNWIYNSDNRTLQWPLSSDPTKLTSFYLVRSKIAFEYTYKKNGKLAKKDIGGELIDVSLSTDKDSNIRHFLDNYDRFVQEYKLLSPDGNSYVLIKAYSLTYLAKDLADIVFSEVDRPWNGGPKYGKRVYRLFFLTLMDMLDKLKTNKERQDYLNDVNAYILTPLKGLYPMADSAAGLAIANTILAHADSLKAKWPNLEMNETWAFFPQIIKRLANTPAEGDQVGFEELLRTIDDNMANGNKLVDGSLGAPASLNVTDLYTVPMSRLF